MACWKSGGGVTGPRNGRLVCALRGAMVAISARIVRVSLCAGIIVFPVVSACSSCILRLLTAETQRRRDTLRVIARENQPCNSFMTHTLSVLSCDYPPCVLCVSASLRLKTGECTMNSLIACELVDHVFQRF